MQLNRIVTAVAVALAIAPIAAFAQDPATDAAIGLTVENGSVLVSTGGEFVQATPGQVLQPGQRVLVAEGASASLNYSGGCQTPLAQPGVYTVSATCNVAGTRTTGEGSSATAGGAGGSAIGTGTVVAGVVGGIAVVAAVAGGGGSDDPPPPPPPVSL
ncbi:MAG TPA: hypothetical protein VIG97_10310 [Luteimonas sp.]